MNLRTVALITALLPLPCVGAEWHDSYAKALKEAKKRDVPVLVYFSESEPGAVYDKASEDFVLVKAIKSTPQGDEIYKLFNKSSVDGCSVIERTQEWQFSRYDRKLSDSEVQRLLEQTKGATGVPTADVLRQVSYEETRVVQPQVINPPTYSTWGSSSYCPSCQRR